MHKCKKNHQQRKCSLIQDQAPIIVKKYIHQNQMEKIIQNSIITTEKTKKSNYRKINGLLKNKNF